MNTLEKEIIRRYRQVFPKDTLKAISLKTGIQLTRVFRIMNGKPMKVRELEVFEKILNQECSHRKPINEIDRLTKMAITCLSIQDLNHIMQVIERKIQNAELRVQHQHFDESENLIA